MTSTPPNEPAEPTPDPAAATTGALPAESGAVPAGPPPGIGYGQPYPFAPVQRQPRVPWVNPDRRSHVLGAGVIGGLVVLAAGFGIGWAASPGGHDRHDMRIERGGGYFPRMMPGQGGQFPGPAIGRRRLPGIPSTPVTPRAPATPTPTSTK